MTAGVVRTRMRHHKSHSANILVFIILFHFKIFILLLKVSVIIFTKSVVVFPYIHDPSYCCLHCSAWLASVST